MSITVRTSPRVSPPVVWLALWAGIFLGFGCICSIPVLAVHRPLPLRYIGMPVSQPDWRILPLLIALYASALTWQSWYERENGEGREKTSKMSGAATRPVPGWVATLAFVVPVILLQCCWIFLVPGTRVNWSLLAALNIGSAAGAFCVKWSNRQREAIKEMRTFACVVNVSAPTAEKAKTARYAKKQIAIPETMVTCLVFLCLFAIIMLAFTPAFSVLAALSAHPDKIWPFLVFMGSLGGFCAAFGTSSCKDSRYEDQMRFCCTQDWSALERTSKNATGFYVQFLVMGLMCSVATLPHLDWSKCALCNAGEYAVFRLLRWILSRPPNWD